VYLRTTKRARKDGSTVAYYQLAHNRWDAEKRRSQVEVVHNFGRADDLDREALVRLCRSIAKVCGVEVTDRVGGTQDRADDLLADGVTLHASRALGVPYVVASLWKQLEIGNLIRKLIRREGAAQELETALLAIVTNRLDVPASKLGVHERWLDTVFLPGAEELKRGRLYDALDFFSEHQDEIEQGVFFQVANLMNLDVDLVFYDTTTAEFAIDEGDEYRRFGHSKDSRWTPQVVVALAVTREGFPVRSWVLPGNTTDVTTIEKIRADLRGWKLHRVLFVADAGMNSEANRAELARACGRYVLATRTSGIKEVQKEVLGRAGRFKKLADNLYVKEVVVGEGERRRRYLVCRNPAQAEREKAHREQVLAELEEELASHKDHSPTPKGAAQLRASGRYGRYLAVKGGKLKINRTKVRETARHDGKWVLITNDDSLSADDAAHAYKSLLVIERCFRSLKSTQIHIRPMFHRLQRRIEAHIKLCVLALLIERIAEHRCGTSWPRLRHDLATLQAAEFRTATDRFFRRTEVTTQARSALKKLGVKPPSIVLATSPLPTTLLTT